MAKLAKLFLSIANQPGSVSFRDFERVLVAFGFTLVRTRGSHRAYAHPSAPRLMVVQPRGTEAKPYQVRQFLDMIEQYSLPMDE